jgi:hypothetical protein
MSATLPTPRHASPVEVVRAALRTTPGRLWFAGAATWLATLVFFFAVWYGVEEQRAGVKTVGQDSALSIMAAQQISGDLADLHATAVRELLSDPGLDRDAAEKRYAVQRRAVTKGLLAAARNITYKEEEVPIRELINALGKYETAIGQARVLPIKERLEPLRKADDILHGELLPNATALDQANRKELDAGYTKQQLGSLAALATVGFAGIALMVVLILTQLYLRRRTRRALNPALLAATVLTGGFLIATLATFLIARAALREAVKDAFDSIHVLEKALADAADARTAQRLRLLDEARADTYDGRFHKQAALLVELKAGLKPQKLKDEVNSGRVPDGFDGLLATELRNITYPGEHDAAAETLAWFLDYLALDDRVRELERANKPYQALVLSRGDADRKFEEFVAALAETRRINKTAFDAAIARGEAALGPFGWAAPVVAVAVALLAAAGLRPRLKEYSP